MSYSKNFLLASVAVIAVTSVSLNAFADEAMLVDTAPISNMTPAANVTTVERPLLNSVKKSAFDFKKLLPALEAREDAIANSWVTEFEAKQLALLNRRISLTNAYNLADNKSVKIAVKAAHKAYHDAVELARKNGRAERKAAWETFNNTVKVLRVTTSNRVEGTVESSKDQE